MRIEMFKEELDWVIDKRLRVISNKMLFTTVVSLRYLKNKAILNLKQYCMCCYVTLSNVATLNSAYKDVFIIIVACWPVTRYVILLFVFNTVCYSYLR